MEAKDTAKLYGDLRRYAIGDMGILDPTDSDLNVAQAAISFKAGRREVVEWIEENAYWHNLYNKHSPDFQDGYEFTVEEWQAFKKERGL